jgi:hypothetical protein
MQPWSFQGCLPNPRGKIYVGKHLLKNAGFSFLDPGCCPRWRKCLAQEGPDSIREAAVSLPWRCHHPDDVCQDEEEPGKVEVVRHRVHQQRHPHRLLRVRLHQQEHCATVADEDHEVSRQARIGDSASGTVWIDEACFDVAEKSKIPHSNVVFLRGISLNKVCAELAVDSTGRAYVCVMRTEKPTSAMILWALRGHLQDYLDCACFRQRLRAVSKHERRQHALRQCALTGVDFIRPRRRQRKKARQLPHISRNTFIFKKAVNIQCGYIYIYIIHCQN